MGSFKKHIFVIALLSCFLLVTATASMVGAPNQSSNNTNVTVPQKMGVKIISPSKNTTVPTGELIMHGISSDTPKINCKVFADWNDMKPMQNVSAKGPGGAND